MKLDMNKEWYEKKIAQEGDLEVGAGIPLEETDVPEDSQCIGGQAQDEFIERHAFGSLVQLLRRSKGLSVEQLADASRVDPAEIISIERDPKHSPRRDAHRRQKDSRPTRRNDARSRSRDGLTALPGSPSCLVASSVVLSPQPGGEGRVRG